MTTEVTRRLDMRAMGTTLSIYGPSGSFAAGAAAVVETFREEEQRFSRFRSDSELSRMNARAGSWVAVSEAFGCLLEFSLAQAAATDGAFDPTVLAAVEAAGYDRDFDEVIRSARGALRPPVPCGRWTEIEVRGRSVRLPSDVGLDLGGVAKGWTVDLAVDRALEAGLSWVLVSAGGDLRIGGAAPALSIDVEDPDEPTTPILALRLDRGALATSSTAKRAWGPGLHHVIDPRTGAPAVTDAVQATVWAPTCADAEVAATTALLMGTSAVAAAPSVIVAVDGTLHNSVTPAVTPARPDDPSDEEAA
jgi:thiamine biosynthesis lipoprotein